MKWKESVNVLKEETEGQDRGEDFSVVVLN